MKKYEYYSQFFKDRKDLVDIEVHSLQHYLQW